MKILISNDDGVDSIGIRFLAKMAESLGDVWVVAPHRERSTSGHSLTLHKPLRIIPYGPRVYATTGSPADCIYFGIREILKEKPDVILTGINRGANLGTDVHYSGTVAAAREGAVMNIPSYAFSLAELTPGTGYTDAHFEEAAAWAKTILTKMLSLTLPKHTVINVNFPCAEKIKGMKLARQGLRLYQNEVVRRTDPRGKDYFWIGGSYRGFEADENSDLHVVHDGFASITPLTIDCTHNEYYTTLKQLPF